MLLFVVQCYELGPPDRRAACGSDEAQAACPQKSIFLNVTLLVEIKFLLLILKKIILVGNIGFVS